MSYPVRYVRSDELREGMIIRCYGMRCLIDQPIKSRPSQNGGEATPRIVYWTDARVLNREDVDGDLIPYSFTDTSSYPSRGLPPSDAPHRWGIQGADFVTWAVEA